MARERGAKDGPGLDALEAPGSKMHHQTCTPEGEMNLRRAKMRSMLTRAASGFLVAAGLLVGTAHAAPAPAPVFDWSVTDASGNAAYTPAPFLTDQTVGSVASFLASRPAGSVLAVKVSTPISNATAAAIFNTFKIKYVFADFESGNVLNSTKALVNQIHAAGSQSTGAFIGQFNLYNTKNDGTRSTSVPNGAASFSNVFNQSDYLAAGVNMSNESAYPGSPDFALPGHGTSSPNLRSALFVLPIDRVTFITDFSKFGQYVTSTPNNATPGGFANIPWVARFNNWGNNLLNNHPGYLGYKYAFDTTAPNSPYANQLLSAGDFSAQVLQDRLRGASSYNLFNYSDPGIHGGTNTTFSSVIGYT